MKAKTKKRLHAEIENGIGSGGAIHADAAGKAWISTSRGMMCIPDKLKHLITDAQWQAALARPRVHFACPALYDNFIR